MLKICFFVVRALVIELQGWWCFCELVRFEVCERLYFLEVEGMKTLFRVWAAPGYIQRCLEVIGLFGVRPLF